jgi:hypothetical protein
VNELAEDGVTIGVIHIDAEQAGRSGVRGWLQQG